MLKGLKHFKLGERGIRNYYAIQFQVLLFCSSLVHLVPQLMHFFCCFSYRESPRFPGFLLVCLSHRPNTHPSMQASCPSLLSSHPVPKPLLPGLLGTIKEETVIVQTINELLCI